MMEKIKSGSSMVVLVDDVSDITNALHAHLHLHHHHIPTSPPHFHHIYSEAPNGKQEEVSKSDQFKEVISDILLDMATGLKRDPIVILRMDGEDLLEFLKSPSFEPELISVLSEIEFPDGRLQDFVIKAFEKLTVDQGMPPASDPWVMSNFVEPALQSCCGDDLQQPFSRETFLVEFKKVGEGVSQLLKEQPVIVAHSETTFDGNGIKRLLSNKFELDKTLEFAVKGLPKDRQGKVAKEYLRAALDLIAPSASLPVIGVVDQMDNITNEALTMTDVDDGKTVKDDEFKKLLTEVLGNIMLKLEGNPVSVSTNSVVHEPLSSASTPSEPSSP